MASADAWTDFEQIRHAVKHNTVDKLKQIITGFNEECGTNLSKSGKKQDIIDRVTAQLDCWRTSRIEDKWLRAKNILAQVRSYGSYTQTRTNGTAAPLGGPITYNTYSSSPSTKLPTYSALQPGGSSTSIARYDPYAPPRKPTTTPSAAYASSSSGSGRPTSIRFKDSPFFRIDQQVSTIVECPESTSAMDRRQQTLQFTLNADQINKLKQEKSRYQLRLFCTSSTFYAPSTPTAFRTSNGPCPIEFPPTCEVRVNGTQLTANLKGLKKKPGTAPPPDLGSAVRWNTSGPNRIEMVYVNSSQPAQAKKFFLVVMLVATNSVESLVEDLKANSRRSNTEIKQKMLESANDDDDIQAGPQKMSLKCPLSYMRVVTPCRSSKCVHSQCFDATSWFSMMEQTTTYLCPTCERTLDYRDLIIDGYFDEILKETPESVEDVIVEADGEWHTSDNKYGSASWKATHPYIPPAPSPTKQAQPAPLRNNSDTKGKARAEVVELLDSEDEEEGQVKRELSPSNTHALDGGSFSAQSQRSTSALNNDVIDLTLSDDDEPTPPTPRLNKRTADTANLPSYQEPWKRNRTATPQQQHQPLPSQSPQHQQRSTHQPPPPPPPPQPLIPPQSGYNAYDRGISHHHGQQYPPIPRLNGYDPVGSRQGQQQQAPAAMHPSGTYSNGYGNVPLTESRQLPPIKYPPPPRWQ